MRKSGGINITPLLNVIGQFYPSLGHIQKGCFPAGIWNVLRNVYAMGGILPVARRDFTNRHFPLPTLTSFDILGSRDLGLCSERKLSDQVMDVRFAPIANKGRAVLKAKLRPLSAIPRLLFLMAY